MFIRYNTFVYNDIQGRILDFTNVGSRPNLKKRTMQDETDIDENAHPPVLRLNMKPGETRERTHLKDLSSNYQNLEKA